MTERTSAATARGFVPLTLGLAAIVGGTLIGVLGLGSEIGAWPLALRAALVGLSVAIGFALLGRAVTMLADAEPRGSSIEDRDVRPMIRAVRLVFLAVAAFAAAGAWLLGHPLLLVVAAIIAGVDVLETSFLLLVARRHHEDDRSGS